LSALRRVGTGGFEVTQCVTLEALEAMTEEQRMACLMPVDSLLVKHTVVTLDAENAGRFLSGVRRRGDWADNEQVAVYGPAPVGATGGTPGTPGTGGTGAVVVAKVLLGTAHVKAGELIPGRLLSPLEIEQMIR
jgi:tRNA pseudouridine55 synthase